MPVPRYKLACLFFFTTIKIAHQYVIAFHVVLFYF